MTEQVHQATGWNKAGFDESVEKNGTPAMKALWALKAESIVTSATKNNISPMSMLAMMAGNEHLKNPSDSVIAETTAQFSGLLDNYGGDMRAAMSAVVSGKDQTDAWVDSTGGLPTDRPGLEYQDRVLSGYNAVLPEDLPSKDMTLASRSNEPTDANQRPASEHRPGQVHHDASPGELDNYLKMQQQQQRDHPLFNPDMAMEIYAEPSHEDAFDLMNDIEIPATGDHSFLTDMKNAFVGGLSMNVTDTALISGVIAEKLGWDSVGGTLKDWSMSTSAAVERRFAVENPTFWTALSSGLGTMVPSVVVGGGFGRLVGVSVGRKLSARYAAELAKKGMVSKVGNVLAGRAGQMGFAAGAALPESFSQAGNTYANALTQGASEDEAWIAARNDGLRNIGILGTTDMILGVGLGSGWVQVMRNAAARGVSEGAQEIFQGISQRWAVQDYSESGFHLYDQDMLMEGGVGFVLGAVVGTGMASLDPGEQKKQKAKDADQFIDSINHVLGLRKGTIQRIEKDVLGKFKAMEVKPQTPEESATLMKMQMTVAQLEQLSDGEVDSAGVPVRVAQMANTLYEVLNDPLARSKMSEQELRQQFLMLSAIENHTMLQHAANSVGLAMTLDQQVEALNKAVAYIEEHGTKSLTPTQLAAVSGMMQNLIGNNMLSENLLQRFSKADPLWAASGHLAQGRSAVQYAGEVRPLYAEGEGPGTAKPIGWSVVYTTANGTVQQHIDFATEAEAQAKMRELRSEIISPEDLGVKSAASYRMEETESQHKEKGETAQGRINRLIGEINKLSADIDKIDSALDGADSSFTPEEISLMEADRVVAQELLNLTRVEYEAAQDALAGNPTPNTTAGEGTNAKPAEKTEAKKPEPKAKPKLATLPKVSRTEYDRKTAPEPVIQEEPPAPTEAPPKQDEFEFKGLPPALAAKADNVVGRLTSVLESIGYTVNLDANLPPGVNGQVDVKSKVVNVSPYNITKDLLNSPEGVSALSIDDLVAERVADVFAHEVGHSIYETKGDDFNSNRTFVSALLAEVQESDFELSERISDKLNKQYPGGRVPGEVLADMLGEVLVTEQGVAFFEEFVALNQGFETEALSVIQMAKKFLRDLWHKTGRKENSFELTMLRRLEQLERRIKKQVRNSTSKSPVAPSTVKPDLAIADAGLEADTMASSQFGPVYDSYENYSMMMDTQLRHQEYAERKLGLLPEGHADRKRSEYEKSEAENRIEEMRSLNPEFAKRFDAGESTSVSPAERLKNPAKRSPFVRRPKLPRLPTSGGQAARPSSTLTEQQSGQATATLNREGALRSAIGFLTEGDLSEGMITDEESTTPRGVTVESVENAAVEAVLDILKPIGPRSTEEVALALQFAHLYNGVGLPDGVIHRLENRQTSIALDEAVTSQSGIDASIEPDPRDDALVPGDGPISTSILQMIKELSNRFGYGSGRIAEFQVIDALDSYGVDRGEIERMTKAISDSSGTGQTTYSVAELAELIAIANGGFESIQEGYNELGKEKGAGAGIPTGRTRGIRMDTQERLEKELIDRLATGTGVERPSATSRIAEANIVEANNEANEFFALGLPFKKKNKLTAHQDESMPDLQDTKDKQHAGARREHKSFREKLDEGRLGFYKHFIDQGHQSKHIVEMMNDKTSEQLLLQGHSFYHNMKGLMTGWGSAADLMIQHGWHDYETGEKIVIGHGDMTKRGRVTKGLGQILVDNGIEKNEAHWADLNAYLQNLRLVTLYENDITKFEEGYDIGPARRAVSQAEGRYNGKNGKPNFSQTAAEIDLFARGMATFLFSQGNISDTGLHNMLSTKFYIPLHSAGLKKGGQATGGNQKAIRGTDFLGIIKQDSTVLPPLDEISAQAAEIVHAAYSNRVKVKLADMLNEQLNPELGEELDLITGQGLHTRGQVVGSSTGTQAFRDQLIAQIEGLASEFSLDENTKAQLIKAVTGSNEEVNVQIWLSKIDLGDDMVAFYRNGKFSVMRVHQDIIDRFQQEGESASGKLVAIAAKSTRLLRTGATLDPGFWARNFLRDVPSAIMGSIGMVNNPADAGRFIGALLGNPRSYLAGIQRNGLKGLLGTGTLGSALSGEIDPGYFLHGAGMSTLSSRDQEADFDERRKTVDGLMKKGFIQSSADVLRHPLQFLEHLSSTMETATRLAVYQQRLKEHSGEAIPWHIASQLAALDSRDATIDFARMGKYGRILNKLSPFWNAQVQGLDKMARTFVKDPTGTMLRGTMMLTVPSMALYALNADEPWYQRLPSWQKNMFWVFSVNDGETIYRIPKPFDWGMLFASLPERMADDMMIKDPVAMKNWASMFSQMMVNVDVTQIKEGNIGSLLSTMPMPPIAGSVAALVSGYDPFTQAKIVSPGVENVRPSQQYTHNTSWLARAAVEFLEGVGVDSPLLNPIEIDYMVRANFGGLGTNVLFGASAVARKAGLGGPPEGRFETKDWVDRAMFLSAFNVDEHAANSTYSTQFHELLRAAAEAERTVNLAMNTGDRRDIKRFKHLFPLASVSKSMRATAEQAKVYTASLRMLEHDSTIDGDVKRDKHHRLVSARDRLYQMAIPLFREAMGRAEEQGDVLKGRL